jgi:glycosyltransferase involved in cell wall biosynthesis
MLEPNGRDGAAVIRVLHIIIGLNVGGAELMLKRLIESHQGNPNYVHSVISLTLVGKVGAQLQEIGVEVRAVGMRSPLDILRVLWQLVRMIRAERPDIVQTWMYHADLLGGLAARLAGNRHVIWGVRGSAIPQSGMSATQVVVTLCSWMSHFLPSVIVCCAASARVAHAERGYDQTKMVVIPNGYELAHFNRNPILRQQARAAFGFSDDDVVVGIVGRFDPLKDYRNFVLAATVVAAKVNHVKFLMVGRDIDSTNNELKGWLDESGLAHKFVLAGERSDIPECLAAMDMFCLSSSKEGFPNVVCEAMAMNVPCVVTDAGDAAEIVSDTGIVVVPRDSSALAGALQAMISKGVAERSRLGELARLRIEKNYSIEIASARFENLYKQVAGNTDLNYSA